MTAGRCRGVSAIAGGATPGESDSRTTGLESGGGASGRLTSTADPLPAGRCAEARTEQTISKLIPIRISGTASDWCRNNLGKPTAGAAQANTRYGVAPDVSRIRSLRAAQCLSGSELRKAIGDRPLPQDRLRDEVA